MSYDIDLDIPPCHACGHINQPEGLNPTYNLGPIFRLAIEGGLQALNGNTACATVEQLTRAATFLVDPANNEALKALEPENGWGTLDGARETINKMLAMALRYPGGTWRIT